MKNAECVLTIKINAVIKTHFPLFFMESILEVVARHKMYTLMDGYSGSYNQIMITLEDQLKTSFISEYEAFAYQVMFLN